MLAWIKINLVFPVNIKFDLQRQNDSCCWGQRNRQDFLLKLCRCQTSIQDISCGRWNSMWSNDLQCIGAVGCAGQTPRLVFLFSQSILKSWSNDVPLQQIIGWGYKFKQKTRKWMKVEGWRWLSVAMRNEDLPGWGYIPLKYMWTSDFS